MKGGTPFRTPAPRTRFRLVIDIQYRNIWFMDNGCISEIDRGRIVDVGWTRTIQRARRRATRSVDAIQSVVWPLFGQTRFFQLYQFGLVSRGLTSRATNGTRSKKSHLDRSPSGSIRTPRTLRSKSSQIPLTAGVGRLFRCRSMNHTGDKHHVTISNLAIGR